MIEEGQKRFFLDRPIKKVVFDGIAALRQSGCRKPYTPTELRRLLAFGSIAVAPREDAPYTYEVFDPSRGRSNEELQAECPGQSPLVLRESGREIALELAQRFYEKEHRYEQAVLAKFPHLAGISYVSMADYLGYLAAFHSREMEAFFRPWALPISTADLKAHCYLAAESGHGKSEVLKLLLYSHFKAGHATIVLDPHGDLAEQIVKWPEFAEFPEKLVYFDPFLANKDGKLLATVPVINPLDILKDARLIDEGVDIFLDILESTLKGDDADLSGRMQALVYPMLHLLAHEDSPDLHRLLDVLTNEDKAQALFAQFGHRLNTSQRTMYHKLFDGNYKNSYGGVLDRLCRLISPDVLDRCLVGKSTINIAEAMAQKKFVVFNLRGGNAGTTLGRFVLASVLHAAHARQALSLNARHPVFLCIDEADLLVSKSLERIAKETRKFRVYLTLAQQMTGSNMSADAWRAIEGNTRIRIAGASRERQTVRTLSELVGVDADTIKNIPERSFYLQVKNRPALFTQMWDGLADNRHQMHPKQWQKVKSSQIANYYQKWNAPGIAAPHFVQADGKIAFDIEKSDAPTV